MDSTNNVDPRAICDRYTDDIYAKMRDDGERTSAYARAIAAAAPGKVCLDVGTGALALLALLAAKAGAKHVYAVEANAEAAEAARATVAAAGFADKITILDGYSTDVRLPEPVDLLLHEIFGEVAGAEGVVHAITDAARRHMRPLSNSEPTHHASVPAVARSLLCPAEFPSPEYFAALPHPMIASPGATSFKLPNLPLAELYLSDKAKAFEVLDFTRLNPSSQHEVELRFVAKRDGTLRGLAIHIEIEMGVQPPPQQQQNGNDKKNVVWTPTEVDVSSAREGSHWPNVFLMLPEPYEIVAGQTVRVLARAALGSEKPKYSFEVALEESGGAVSRELGTVGYPD